MRKEDLFRAIGNVRDEMILEAEPVKRQNTVQWKILSMAAIAVLVIGGAIFVTQTKLFSQKSGDAAPAAYEDTIDVEKEETVSETAANTDEMMPAPVSEPLPEAEEATGVIPETSQAIGAGDGDAKKGAAISEEASFESTTRMEEENDIEADVEAEMEMAEAEDMMPEAPEQPAEAAMEDGADEAVEEEAADEAEVAVMEHESSVNLAGRELQKESSAQEILNGLAAGITPDPKTVSVPTLVQSLDYSKLLQENVDPHFCGELILMKQGNGLLLIHTEVDKDEYITLYAQLPEDTVSGIRVYGDPEYIQPLGSIEILSEEVKNGETRTVLLDLELNKNAKAGKMTVQLELVTDDGEIYKVETCTLKAAAESKMSGSMRLAYAAAQTGVLMKSESKDQKSAYQRILVELEDLPEASDAEILRELINYLIKD